MVTWANLPQGNEVSSRLLGGNGGGRIRPRLTQAGRGISPRSLQPNPLPPPPPSPLGGTGAQLGSRPAPLPSPEAGVSFRPGFPAPTALPRVQELPALGRDRGAGRMSPHGKRAGGQAQGQPRLQPSTPRAPDRGGCEPRTPCSPGAPLLGTACGRAGTHLCTLPGCPSAPTHPGQSSTERYRARCPAFPPSSAPSEAEASGSPPLRLQRYTTAAAAPALQQRGA